MTATSKNLKGNYMWYIRKRIDIQNAAVTELSKRLSAIGSPAALEQRNRPVIGQIVRHKAEACEDRTLRILQEKKTRTSPHKVNNHLCPYPDTIRVPRKKSSSPSATGSKQKNLSRLYRSQTSNFHTGDTLNSPNRCAEKNELLAIEDSYTSKYTTAFSERTEGHADTDGSMLN